ncbi:MAG: hypothetical protein JRI28_06195, partial [Deltaproteobacteria bacterium]|nr:hypothetical protein [Deltaproteobacteria bacterium]
VGDEYLGVAGGCGLILDDGEVESFLISKTTDIDEDEIESLSDDISKITTDKAESLVAYIQKEIDRIVLRGTTYSLHLGEKAC